MVIAPVAKIKQYYLNLSALFSPENLLQDSADDELDDAGDGAEDFDVAGEISKGSTIANAKSKAAAKGEIQLHKVIH